MSLQLGLQARTHRELALLVPEYLLAGHLIDRAGMPHLIGAFGREGMRDIAIEEWRGASPLYTGRMQRALGSEGDSVETIFKGFQFDIGSPPQFMDFRFRVQDHDHGEFWLDHCGALMDVEPLGPEFVVTMCHDIEDPTFDATAAATNARARVRPIHRPPREPADRAPHCHWEVTIDERNDPLPVPPEATALAGCRAASQQLEPIDRHQPGRSDYGGPLVPDLSCAEWSPSALRRIAEEVCLQGHLLALSFMAAIRIRVPDDEAAKAFGRKQCAGVAGVVAERLRSALGLGRGLDDLAQVLSLHPALLPTGYVGCTIERADRLRIAFAPGSGAQVDQAWPALFDPDHLDPLDAIVRAVDPRFRCVAVSGAGDGDGDGFTVEVVVDDRAAPVAPEVLLTRFSTGAEFAFADRRSSPVEFRRP